VGSSALLYCLADIVGFSGMGVIRQGECQDLLVQLLDMSMEEAGVDPASVTRGDRGDALIIAFPPRTDVARVLARMTRRLDDEIRARNKYVEPGAQLRVRLSYALGPAAPGALGDRGRTPVAVTRLSNASQFRKIMKSLPNAYVGVIVDDFLYQNFVCEDYRADLCPDEYRHCRVHDADKSFDAGAWIRILACSPDQWDLLLKEEAPARPQATGVRLSPPQAAQPQVNQAQEAGAAHPVHPAATEGQGCRPAPEFTSGEDARRPGHRWTENPGKATIVAAVIAGVSALAVVALTHVLGGGSTPSADPPASGVTSSPPAPGKTGPSKAGPGKSGTSRSGAGAANGPAHHGAAMVMEYADLRAGVQVYASNTGEASNLPDIPFNQGVKVTCRAPNNSGIASINSFYLIGSGRWKGAYTSANEFTNGGPLGVASDPWLDPRIRACPSA
jgi:hypothetical protein